MREIKFRGKNIKTGEWEYGYYIYSKENNRHYIYFEEKLNDMYGYVFNNAIVDGKTVGQYTGMIDKNREEIYEGDIVLYNRNIDEEVDCYKYEVVFHRDQYGLKELKFGYYLWDVQWDMIEVIKN